MKGVLAWVKANVLIVVFCAIIVLTVPAAFMVSRAWGKSLRDEQEKRVTADLRKVNAGRVDYTIPQYDPKGEAITFRSEPHPKVTQWFKERRERFAAEANDIVKSAEDFNRGAGKEAQALGRREHVPLVPGLFDAHRRAEAELRESMTPEAWNALPEEDRKARVAARAKAIQEPLLYDMEDRLLGRGYPNPYQRLLDGINAGGPLDPVNLLAEVNSIRTAEMQKLGVRRELTPEEAQALAKKLYERRVGGYQARAMDISVFATMDLFNKDDKKGMAVRTEEGGGFDPREIEPVNLFVYQWDLWLYADLLAGVEIANTGPDRSPLKMDQSVVKRVVSILADMPESIYGPASEPAMDASGLAPPDPVAAVAGMVPTDPKFSITGRGNGRWNSVYDVRTATMKCVVASARVQDFLAALERANFNTVIGLTIRDVDVWEHLRQGYYYGPDHVVEVEVKVESVWLRSWLAAYMPEQVAQLLGASGGSGSSGGPVVLPPG